MTAPAARGPAPPRTGGLACSTAAVPPAATHLLSNRERRPCRARRSPLCLSAAPRKRGGAVSLNALDWVWDQPVRGTRQHVLLALAKRVRPKSETAAPSMPELCEMTGLSETTIRGHLQALSAAGVIAVSVSNGGRHKRSTYVLPGCDTPRRKPKTPREPRGSAVPSTPQEPDRSSEETPRMPGGSDEETPNLPRKNPSGGEPVVLRTEGSKRGRSTSCTAAAVRGEAPADGLFGEPPRASTPEAINAGHAVAAWTEAYAETHRGKPTSRATGQVGRECRQLLEAGNAGHLVIAAARQAGARGFANVEREFHDMTRTAPASNLQRATSPQQVGTGTERAQAFMNLKRRTPA